MTVKLLPTCVALSLGVLLSSTAGATTGREIAQKSYDRNVVGFKGQRNDSVMTLYDASGEKVVAYKLNTLTREGVKGEKTMTLIRFLAPADTKGTALLTHETKTGDESRWLFLSETRQVKQIAGASKSASFKGSEFAYEDLVTDTLEKYEYKLLGEEKVDGRDTYKIEQTPKFADSGYSKVINWFDKQNLYVVKSEFYDRAGKLLKTGAFGAFKEVGGKWRSHKALIQNVQTKRRTTVVTGTYELGLDLSERMFTVHQLQKQ